MKLHKKITVAGNRYEIVSSNIRIGLFTPGRALFTLQAAETIKGLVVFSCGYNADAINPWFVGFVEACTTVDKKQQRIFCRELSAALFYRLPLALRDVDLQQALGEVSELTGLEFSIPGGSPSYTTAKAAAFYNTGNGFHAMDSLAGVFGISKPLWQQQVDGKIYVGGWDDSPWANKRVDIDRSWERQLTSHNGATLPALPALRPGALYNGSVLTNVELTGTQMNISWSANPWAER